MKEKLLISACFLHQGYKYNGKGNIIDLSSLEDKYEFIPVCPEIFGSLSCPRLPSEIVEDKVINKEGIDVTKNFVEGSMKSLRIALENGCKIALLKQNSPSCGSKRIYDGTFSNNLVDGMGVFARMLKENDILIFDETEIEKLKER